MERAEYSNALDVVFKVVRDEGFLRLWSGFLPYYLRLAPHTVITFLLHTVAPLTKYTVTFQVLTFVFLEQFNAAYRRHVLEIEDSGSRGL